jgi:hypothetical protein
MATKKAANNGRDSDYSELLGELRTIKQLLVILLAKLGSDSGEIGKALRVEPRRVRDLISFNEIERVIDRTGKGRKRVVEEDQVEVTPVTEEQGE